MMLQAIDVTTLRRPSGSGYLPEERAQIKYEIERLRRRLALGGDDEFTLGIEAAAEWTTGQTDVPPGWSEPMACDLTNYALVESVIESDARTGGTSVTADFARGAYRWLTWWQSPADVRRPLHGI